MRGRAARERDRRDARGNIHAGGQEKEKKEPREPRHRKKKNEQQLIEVADVGVRARKPKHLEKLLAELM